eukprot:4493474-Amphidinium_carterae.1
MRSAGQCVHNAHCPRIYCCFLLWRVCHCRSKLERSLDRNPFSNESMSRESQHLFHRRCPSCDVLKDTKRRPAPVATEEDADKLATVAEEGCQVRRSIATQPLYTLHHSAP